MITNCRFKGIVHAVHMVHAVLTPTFIHHMCISLIIIAIIVHGLHGLLGLVRLERRIEEM